MSKNTPKMITLSPEMWEMVDIIQTEHGLLKQQDAIRYAVSFTYKKEHPTYVEVLKERKARTAEDKAEEKISVEEAKAKVKLEKEEKKKQEAIENGERIARELRAEIYTDRHGDRKCKYYVYQFTNTKNASVGERVAYLEDLSDNDIETQYMNTITNEPEDPVRVIETLVSLGLTDKEGKPIK